MGTRSYRPPEAVLFDKEYDYQADIWSLGCILSELARFTSEQDLPITNQRIFRATNPSPPRLERLFRGSTLRFPHSPKRGDRAETVSLPKQDEILRVILRNIGNPSE
mmetsp:Transcript_36833/g.56394  ORF Transcript_36833/g.56394 Transcript_36833/m.56394 type:complete len:107 (+) Transcript_36833:751-1071(+)